MRLCCCRLVEHAGRILHIRSAGAASCKVSCNIEGVIGGMHYGMTSTLALEVHHLAVTAHVEYPLVTRTDSKHEVALACASRRRPARPAASRLRCAPSATTSSPRANWANPPLAHLQRQQVRCHQLIIALLSSTHETPIIGLWHATNVFSRACQHVVTSSSSSFGRQHAAQDYMMRAAAHFFVCVSNSR